MTTAKSLTVRDIADKEQTSPETVRTWIRAGDLKAYRLGGTSGQWRIRPERYEEFIKAREALRRDPWAYGLSNRRTR